MDGMAKVATDKGRSEARLVGGIITQSSIFTLGFLWLQGASHIRLGGTILLREGLHASVISLVFSVEGSVEGFLRNEVIFGCASEAFEELVLTSDLTSDLTLRLLLIFGINNLFVISKCFIKCIWKFELT